MSMSRVASPLPSTGLSLALLLFSATLAFGAPPVLRWNGSSGGLWDAATASWLDAGDNAVAWQPGSEARFDGAGGLVNVASDVLVSNITFAANGYTLLGAGRLTVEGAVAAAATTTNSVTAEIITAAGLAKTGSGALALARCAGAVAVQEGALLVSGSLFVDADLSVASGASVITLGDPDDASNLILNPGFESPAMGNGAWGYVASGNVISNWTCTALPQALGRQNTVVGNPWNSAGASPEGTHMLIIQYNSAVSQTVTMPADGLYAVAFSYLLRSAHPENLVYVTLDGLPLATFLNRSVQFNPGRFASGALWLAAGSHTLAIAGEGAWDDRASMVDAVCFASPSAANACRALGGDSALQVVSGASMVLDHSGAVPLAYVAIDGSAASGTFDASHGTGIFSGAGALSCAAPANVFTWSGSGLWSETARWLDGIAPAADGGANLLLRFPATGDGSSENDLAGSFVARRLAFAGAPAGSTFTLSGNAVALTNDASGTAPALSQSGPGALTISAPVSSRSSLTLDAFGSMTFSGAPVNVASNGVLYKSGPGTVTTPSLGNYPNTLNVYEGTFQTPALPPTLSVSLASRQGRSAGLLLTQAQTAGNRIYLRGSGTASLATACGGTVTLTDWLTGHGDRAVFDVATGDTLSLRQMLLSYLSGGAKVSATTLTKAGGGTLEIRSGGADAGNNRAYQGNTTLRNGTLLLSEDDWGTLTGYNSFNGRTYTGTGGSLGYNNLTNVVRVGDSATAASDNLALIANGAGRWIGHNIEVFNKGSAVTLGMTTGTVMFAGTVTLHRDVILSGAASGVMAFSNVVAAADFSGTGVPVLSGLAGVRVEGTFPSEASLIMDGRLLSFGTYAVKAQTLNALVLGSAGAPGTLDVDFGAGANDTITTTMPNGLTLSNAVVNLYYAGTGLPFSEAGSYTLFAYAGALGGDAALLSVGNPQSGASYSFSNDTANARVLLTIGNTTGGSSVVWKRPDSGDWSLGANWDTGIAPDSTGVAPLFGLAITTPATVTLGAAYTVGGLAFNNASYGYTLSGGSLTLDDGGATPLVSVAAGTHTLDTTLNGSDGLAVATAAGATLALGGSAVANTGLSLTQGTVELQGGATVNGAADLAAGTLLRAAGSDTAVGTLSGPPAASLSLSGTAPKLTVNQTSDTTFAGTLTGANSATFVKAGASTLTLNNPYSVFSGLTEISAGSLSLQNIRLHGAVAVGTGGTLDIPAPMTNGLTGFYYTRTANTNDYWSLAALEAHVASLTPNVIELSGFSLDGDAFDFGWDATCSFPLPYGAGGSRADYFEAVWRGTLTVPAAGAYTFGVYCDDGFVLGLDGQTVAARNRWVGEWTEGVVRLDAGRHDIVVGYFQVTGGRGLRVRVRLPGELNPINLPNAWLTPYSEIGGLSGAGDVVCGDSNAVIRVNQSGLAQHAGSLAGPAGSLLAKASAGTLALAGQGAANAFAGNVDVRAGLLALAADERLGDASAVDIRGGATLAVTASETVGALRGAGELNIGGYAYATAFTGDADCGVSTDKTYTHLLDFPLSTANPTVNGVTFDDRGTYTGSFPGGEWNSSPFDTSYAGIASLLYDFSYGSYDFTFTLTGLTPGNAYEIRFYFRNWASNPREVVFTFFNDNGTVDAIQHNPDSVARSIVGCRYVADAGGELSVRVVSLNAGHSCHLYGLSNEAVPGATDGTLTVAPAAGTSASFSGAVTGSGTLVKQGAGTQALGGAMALRSPLDVQAGTAVLNAGASLPAGATVAAGATLKAPLGSVTLGALTGEGTFELTGAADYSTVTNGPRFVQITGDADCGISPDKTYTHLIDFGGSTARATVNGVTFSKERTVSGPAFGCSWVNAPASSAHAGGNLTNIGVPSSQGIYNLINDFCYSGPYAPTVCYLTGLTAGKTYEVRFYHRKWEADRARTTTMTFDPDGAGPISDAITFNPDSPAGSYNDNYLAYRYLAQTNRLAVTIACPNPDRYHIYGLSNEEVPGALDGAATLNITGDNVFGGTLTGSGPWTKAGAGTLTFTGTSDATGAVAVEAGAFGVASGGTATLGNVSVAGGATLFGDGLLGGAVTVASNAWIHAGTPAACGTLEVGGDLTLAHGALPHVRFAAGAADAFTVGGLLTFPTNGVLQASALTEGVKPPAKAALFTSSVAINGPEDLTGWAVEGVENCSLAYSDDRTIIYLRSPRGTAILVR